MTPIVYYNGRFVPLARARIPITDRSYLFGEGIFETLRVYDSHPAFVELHYQRLCANARALAIAVPFDCDELQKIFHRVLEKNRLRNASLRICLSPCNTDLALERNRTIATNVVIFARPLALRPHTCYTRGARAMILRGFSGDAPAIAQIKSTSYISKMLARRQVQAAQVEEGIFINERGLILEGTATNLFLVRNGTLYTPPLDDGVLPGVTRAVVLTLADLLKIPYRETHIRVSHLQRADEIFLTGSTTEILPLRDITDVRRYPAPGPVTQTLTAAYRQLTQDPSRLF